MIILNDVPFEKRMRFMRDSMCAYPDSPEWQAYINELPDDLGSGLQALRRLFEALYSDLAGATGKDDPSRYLDVLATADFLYAVCAWGTIHGAGIRVDKAILKTHYKKGSLGKRQKHLARYGVQVEFTDLDGHAVSMSTSTHVRLSCPDEPALVPAAHAFASRAVNIQPDNQMPLCNAFGVFLRADFKTAFLDTLNVRNDLNPLRPDLAGIFDTHLQDWKDLATHLLSCALASTGFWTYGGVPAWGVSFAENGKRPLAIFTLCSDSVFIEFTLPLNAAATIIQKRHTYSDKMRKKIEGLHCVKCPKQCKGENLTKVDGVWLCRGRAEARRIYTYLETPEDFASIHAMLDVIYGT